VANEKNAHRTVIRISAPWGIGWLFTIGFAKLSVGQSLLALVIWPYYIGTLASP
jgi:hypothetical protein